MIDKLNYSIEDRDNAKIIHLKGVLTVVTAESFEALIETNIYKSHVILNLQDVRIISSSGMNALINVCITARGSDKRVLLYQAKSEFMTMVEAMNIYEQFNIVDTIEEGLMKLKYYV